MTLEDDRTPEAASADEHSKRSAIFREEAFARFRTALWQPPLLSRPVSGLLLSSFTLLTAVVLIVFAATFPFARKERAVGYLTPDAGWSRVSARSFAVVRRRLVAPGDPVQAGDTLYELASGEGVATGMSVERKLLEEIKGRRASLESRLTAIDARFRNDRLIYEKENAAAERQIAHIETAITSHSARLSIARQRRRDGERLQSSGSLSTAELLELKDQEAARTATLAAHQQQLALLRATWDTRHERMGNRHLEREEARAAIFNQIHALAMEESRIQAGQAGSILAPRTGRIASIRADEGDWVRPGDALLDILPTGGGLKARLFVSSISVSGVEVGQEVRIYLDAFPYERYGAQTGRVLTVSETTLGPQETNSFVGTSGAAPFRVDVEFQKGFDLTPAQSQTLRPGMTVSADLIRDYGTLVDWLLDPLRGATQRL